MEKLFQLKANGTTVRTELLAGLTTFMTMAYIIALNPNLLTNFAVGTPLWNGVFLATCIASAIGTICMAFLANKPFVMAPGMGLNSFFAVVVANIAVINECEYETAFQAALVIILVEGIVFLILTLLKVREKIVEAIPLGVRYGIAPAIGHGVARGLVALVFQVTEGRLAAVKGDAERLGLFFIKKAREHREKAEDRVGEKPVARGERTDAVIGAVDDGVAVKHHQFHGKHLPKCKFLINIV